MEKKFKSIVSLNCGGDAVYVQNEIEWWEQKALLKDAFKLNVSNEYAMYDLGLGAIKRKNNSSKLFEVPAQKWVDISEHDFGISILNDSKYGWDKPVNNTVRMTVLHTPRRNYLAGSMQSHMEVGLNRYGFAIMSHDANLSYTQVQAKMFNQPLAGIITDSHRGDIKNGSISEYDNSLLWMGNNIQIGKVTQKTNVETYGDHKVHGKVRIDEQLEFSDVVRVKLADGGLDIEIINEIRLEDLPVDNSATYLNIVE